jgi:hypothetical protein
LTDESIELVARRTSTDVLLAWERDERGYLRTAAARELERRRRYHVERVTVDRTTRGNWRREIPVSPDPNFGTAKVYGRPRYYWRRLRVPWLIWVLFS